MHGRELILSLIPHQGSMCLLDEVVDWDEARIHCRSVSHRSADHPLRDALGLRAVHLCEYGAQAMAVHGGLLASAAGARARPGLLVSLRAVRIARGFVHELAGPLDVHAEKLIDTASSWQYAFRVEHEGAVLAEGRAAVMVGPDNIS